MAGCLVGCFLYGILLASDTKQSSLGICEFVSIREGYAFCGCSLVANEFCSYEVQLYRCKRSKCVHERRE